ncbi:MAG: hypothetical protein V1727_01235 [Candidatus Omnitrophota bacterium]
MDKRERNKLTLRYLLWLYKTTREELDRIERKFTQLAIDREILRDIKKELRAELRKGGAALNKYLQDLQEYIEKKEKEAIAQKYEGEQLKPLYLFQTAKLSAIERAIVKHFGAKEKERIKSLYEQEMIKRILESKEHR